MTSLRRDLRGVVERFVGPTALVLIYHRVAELERDPQLLAVGPGNFDDQMAMLAERYRLVSLRELAEALRQRTVPKRAIAITFDDGYADNLEVAAPILRPHAIPATVFVSSGYARSGREFWWDELERLVLEPPALPGQISLALPRTRFDWTDEGLAPLPTDPAWNVLKPDPGPRERLYRGLHTALRDLDAPHREQALESLRAQVGVSSGARPSHRPLDVTEVTALDAIDGIDVGGHTIDHEVLSTLPVAEQRRQIVEDRAVLAEICQRDIDLFSYPYGAASDFSAETAAIVRDQRFVAACANFPGVTKGWTDRYAIPRNLVRDWSADALEEQVERWFRGGG